MINALCFDIDDLAYSLNIKNGSNLPNKYLVEKETYALLESLASTNTKATMFVPGYVAERFPSLIRDIAAAGHELGSHGSTHMVAERLQRKGFREDASKSKKMLEDLLSTEVCAYRAPWWGIGARTHWAYDELIAAGYRVDHSAQPSLLKSLGRRPADMTPFTYKGALTVIPVTSCRLFSYHFPFNGGLFCAYVPVSVQIAYYRLLNQKGIPFNYYCHPFEIHPQGFNRHPWKYASVWASFYGIYFGIYRHHLSHLMRRFKFSTLEVVYKGYRTRTDNISK